MATKTWSSAQKGTYSGATAYTIGDFVVYNGSSYTCIANTTGNLPTNGTYWALVVSTGTSGYSGYSGYSGISGYSGADGSAGASGYSGYSGISGYSGTNGTNGTSGYSGYSGYSGISGYSGANGAGSGDVIGPASSTDNAAARFDSTTGKVIQDSAVTIADTTGDITGGKYNKVTITAPATSATLTIADGKTFTANDNVTVGTGGITLGNSGGFVAAASKVLTANNSITLAGTDSTTMTFPSTSKTLAANDGSNLTLSGQAIGDIAVASSTTAYGKLAAVATGSVLVSQGTGTAPAYSANPQVTTIELGHATDTTISRVSAGVIAVEGVNVLTTAGGTLTGNITLGENTSIDLDPAGSADGKYSGICITGTAGATLAFGDLIYLAAADSRWELTDADASATGGPVLIGMCVLAAASDGSATKILLQGQIRADSKFPALTIGAPVYLGETAGAIQTAIPTGADNVIRVVGFALTADEIYFNPSQDHQISVA